MSLFLLLKELFDNFYFSSQTAGKPPSVHTAAALFQKLCYENKDDLSASIIVAGWDQATGPSVFTIPVGGGIFRQPWAIGGKSRDYPLVWGEKTENIG
jgi:20S proteasome subunit beta 1